MKVDQEVKYLSYPSPVFCIGSYNADGSANLMTAVLGGMCSHNPPYFAVSIRPATETCSNIIRNGAFTVNVPAGNLVEIVDYVGTSSARDGDKFAACSLTAVRGTHVNAPYVEEFPAVAECVVRQAIDLGSHTMFIAEIVALRGDEYVISDVTYAGHTMANVPDMARAQGVVLAVTEGHRCYVGIGDTLGVAYAVGRDRFGSRRNRIDPAT